MSELPHHHRRRRARFLALAGALCTIGLLLGVTAARGTSFDLEVPTVQVTVDPTSIAAGDEVTLTALVTATGSYPDGTVTFATLDDQTPIGGSAVQVERVSGLQSKATVQTRSFGKGTYSIVAYFTPTQAEAGVTLVSADTTANPSVLQVNDATPTPTPTHITLTMTDLSGAPLSQVIQGQHVTLVADVTADSGPTPTGGVVHFYDGSQELAHVTLVDGVATADDVASFGPNQHELTASYDGNSPLWSGSQTDAANNAANTFTVESTSPPPTTTHTTLSLSATQIRVGDTVHLTAHVAQDGAQAIPVGGEVYFYSDADCQNGVLGPPVPLGADGTATLTGVGNWAASDYTLCASYVGSTFNTDTPGFASLSVLRPVSPTTLTITGPPTAFYRTTAGPFTATLTDTNGPVVGKDVTIQLGSQSCTMPTNESGAVTCVFAATDPSVATVTASFAGDLVDPTANAHQDFAVIPAPATLAVAMSSPTVLQGTLVETNGGAPIAGTILHLSLGDHSCTTTATNTSGLAACTIGRVDTPTATLAGSSDADARYESASFSQLVTVPTTIETTLQYTGPVTGDFGDDVTLSAVLLDSSQKGVDGETVTLKLGTQSCPATTASDGTASCTITIAQSAGALAASAHFAGNDPYLASDSEDVPFTVTKEETALTLSAPTTAVSGDTLTLTATLREDGTSAIASRSLTFTFAGGTCTKSTGADGTAQCTLPAVGSGATQARVSFAGDDDYAAPTDATADVLVQLHTALTYTGATTGDFDDAVTVSAHLADQTGAAVNGATVSFTLGSQQCTGSTVAGDASCSLTPGQAAGATTLHVAYAGDGSVLLPSGLDPAFTVAREETALSLTTPPAAQQNSTITLTAKLLEDGATPIDGRTVTFTQGATVLCRGTTIGGVATCTTSATAPGPLDVTASFAADGYYQAASTAKQTVYVYAPTPGGGMFVVGDLSATGNVTFWGSQWWKANTLSGGSAPSSFKGYALHASATCGGAWSTDPGNSTPPPAEPLPKYIAVIVASSAAKSGAQISGKTVQFAVVETAGYDSNPGHPGTGKIVATFC